MKKLFLQFGIPARLGGGEGEEQKQTGGDADFASSPMGANPPTDGGGSGK